MKVATRRDDTMATILEEETLVRSQAVIAREVAGETLIIPVRDRVGDLPSIYSLNSTASLIWKLLESSRTLTQLAMAFAQEYEVEPEMVREDVADFLNEMMAVGMVELSAPVMMAEAEGSRGREEWQPGVSSRRLLSDREEILAVRSAV
jgi:hypothetical protein